MRCLCGHGETCEVCGPWRQAIVDNVLSEAKSFRDLPASVFRSTYDPPDSTLVKSTRPATCAVCRQVVTASIVLPDERAVCERCTGIALRNMIDDAAACRGSR